MTYLDMLQNEERLFTTPEGRAQLRDMVYFIVDYIKENKALPPDGWCNDLHRGIGVRRSKLDETILAIDNLAKRQHYDRLICNPFNSIANE